MALALALSRKSPARLASLAIACLACTALPGCSKIRSVLVINRFHENVQMEICGERTTVPADGHAFLEHRQYMPSTGTYVYIRDEKGDLIRRVTVTFNTDETSENCYQDDLVVVEAAPE